MRSDVNRNRMCAQSARCWSPGKTERPHNVEAFGFVPVRVGQGCPPDSALDTAGSEAGNNPPLSQQHDDD